MITHSKFTKNQAALSLLLLTSFAKPALPQTKLDAYQAAAPLQSLSLPMGRNLELGVQRLNNSETLGVAGMTIENDPLGLRLVLDKSTKQDHILLAAGTQIGDNSYLIGGLSTGHEPIPGYDAKMTGKSALIRFDMTNLTPDLRKLFINAVYQDTSSKVLSVTDAAFTESSVTSTNTGYRTTVTQGINRSTVHFYGGQRNLAEFGGQLNIDENGILTVTVKYTRSKLLGEVSSKTEGIVGYKHYFANWNANLGINAFSSGTVLLTAEKMFTNMPISLFLNLSKDFKDEKQYAAFLGFRYHFGEEKRNIGVRPSSAGAQLNDTLSHLYAPKNYFGIVKIETERLVTSQTSTDTVVAAPAPSVPPVVVPPVVIDPPPTNIVFAQSANYVTCPEESPPFVVTTPTVVGSLSCSDVAVTSTAQNACTFTSTNNPNISVSSTGVVTLGAGNYGTGPYVDNFIGADFNVTATDAAGGTYLKPFGIKYIYNCT